MTARERVLDWERKTRTIAVRPELVRLTGGFDTAVMLAQILYWFGEDKRGRARVGVVKAEETWMAKSVNEWAEELGALRMNGSPRDDLVRSMIGRLQRGGFIAVGKWKFNGAPTLHVRPIWEAIEILPDREWISDTAGNGNPAAAEIEIRSTSEIHNGTETTAETTAKNPPRTARGGDAPTASDDAWAPLKTAVARVGTNRPAPRIAGRDGRPYKWIGEIIGAVGAQADDDAVLAAMIWGCFEDSLSPDDRAKYINPGNLCSRFLGWSANGGQSTIQGARQFYATLRTDGGQA